MHFLDRFGFRLHHLLSVRSWENYFPFLHLISSNHKKMELMTSHLTWASPTAQQVNNPPAMQEMRFDPWVGKIPGEEKGYPLQYSGLENSVDYLNVNISLERINILTMLNFPVHKYNIHVYLFRSPLIPFIFILCFSAYKFCTWLFKFTSKCLVFFEQL